MDTVPAPEGPEPGVSREVDMDISTSPGFSRETPGEVDMDAGPAPRETPGEVDMDTSPVPEGAGTGGLPGDPRGVGYGYCSGPPGDRPPEEVDMDTGPAPEGAGTGGLPGDPMDMDISTSPGVSWELFWPTTPVVDIFPVWTHSQRRLSRWWSIQQSARSTLRVHEGLRGLGCCFESAL